MVKTWPTLQTFIHGTYRQRLVAVQLWNTSGQQGCVPTHNMYNVLSNYNGNTDTNDNATATKITQTAAAATTGSTLGSICIRIHTSLSTAMYQPPSIIFWQTKQLCIGRWRRYLSMPHQRETTCFRSPLFKPSLFWAFPFFLQLELSHQVEAHAATDVVNAVVDAMDVGIHFCRS